MNLEIWTDGSSLKNPGKAGFAFIFIAENFTEEVGDFFELATNNQMELTAVLEALKFLKKIKNKNLVKEVKILSDSEYVIKGLTLWIKTWQKNNWKNSKKQDVLNKNLWEEIDILKTELEKDIKIIWQHVYGHSGNLLNDRADKIARSFANQEKMVLFKGKSEDYFSNFLPNFLVQVSKK